MHGLHFVELCGWDIRLVIRSACLEESEKATPKDTALILDSLDSTFNCLPTIHNHYLTRHVA